VDSPFTYEELYAVFARLSPAEEAAEMARLAVSVESRGDANLTSHREYQPVAHVDITEDTLVMLALLSDSTAQKVQRYREERRGGQPESPADAALWTRRYADLKAWADLGYPVEGE